MSLIYIGYCILEDFELELLGPNAQVDNPPLVDLGSMRSHFKRGLGFPFPRSSLNSLGPMRSCYVF